ncbi:unnamed protein product [Bursaphelenchus okinawaensis]|uniref:Uncharacterized protein n=1 Tax=Bursaphelenchus okinawaensis TaxID=465554 RepID=A0A811KUH5_9BILA|nr:unnamed protein product [Bursaphelenchus okinawaensis]CAG9110825.1 unnamed protein product [Bursaphelenchus okinawaensis]
MSLEQSPLDTYELMIKRQPNRRLLIRKLQNCRAFRRSSYYDIDADTMGAIMDSAQAIRMNNMSLEQILRQLRERPLYSRVQTATVVITESPITEEGQRTAATYLYQLQRLTDFSASEVQHPCPNVVFWSRREDLREIEELRSRGLLPVLFLLHKGTDTLLRCFGFYRHCVFGDVSGRRYLSHRGRNVNDLGYHAGLTWPEKALSQLCGLPPQLPGELRVFFGGEA